MLPGLCPSGVNSAHFSTNSGSTYKSGFSEFSARGIGTTWYQHGQGISRMNLGVPNIWVFGGSAGTKNKVTVVNCHCTELMGGQDPGER